MEQLYDTEKARAYIQSCFTEQGDFSIFTKDVFDAMLTRVMALDDEFMQEKGVNDGEVYDDDAAYDFLFAKMSEEYPEQKMYCMRFVEDYMDYAERYLDSIGAIDWE